MIDPLAMTCGSIPEEVFNALQTEFSAYLTSCKDCGRPLISVKVKHDTNSEFIRVYGFFHCQCGAKFKRLALDLSPGSGGYKCKQGAVTKIYKDQRKKLENPFVPDILAVDFVALRKERTEYRYLITPTSIKLKRRQPK